MSTNGPNMQINASDKAVLQWQQFSIGAGNKVVFQLPNSTSQVLNQVTGSDPTQIHGSLQSNGQVWLINPNGILFGSSARVDVAGLVASTLYLSASDFVAGRYRFASASGAAGTVQNAGEIRTPYGGRIVLVGRDVQNSGVLQAPGGGALLLAASSVELVDTGTPYLSVRAPVADGQVLNSGSVAAGVVDVYGAAVNQQGSVVADSLGVNGRGEIVLRASGDLVLGAQSTTQADAGSIAIASDTGAVQVQGAVVASAAQGNGGSIRMDARNLDIASTARVQADAAGVGDGGRIVLWGYDRMSQRGLVTARGGALGGNGGFVETSTHGVLDIRRVPSSSAPLGRPGTWLIDPYDITVVAAPPNGVMSNIDLVPGPPGIDQYAAVGDSSVISVDLIRDALNNGTSVGLDATAPIGTQAGNIYWNAPMLGLSPVTPANLALFSANNIYINASITGNANLNEIALIAPNVIYIDSSVSLSAHQLTIPFGTVQITGKVADATANSAAVAMTQPLWGSGSVSSPVPQPPSTFVNETNSSGLQSKARYTGASGSILDFMPVTGMPGTKVAATNPDMDLPSQPSAAAQLPGYRYMVSDQSKSYFRVLPVSEMSMPEIDQVLKARHEYKQSLLQGAVQALAGNPALPDLPGCASAAESVSGMCLLDPAKDNTTVQTPKRISSRDKRNVVASVPKIARKLALVIGINQYDDKRIPQLVGALPDAVAVNEHLQEELGYDVVMLSNPSKSELFAALNGLAAGLAESDSLLVYYAGHGEMVESTGMGYWIPSDGSADNPKGWVSNSDINKVLARAKSRQMAVIADSCYSGRFTAESKLGENQVAKTIDDLLLKRAVTMMSSGGDEPVADTGKEGHSVFAWNLMQKIREVSSWSSGGDVFATVRTAVESELPQTPQYGASVVAGHEAGADFLFERRSANPARAR
jgi:filamentous hemagglutinin family protein